MNPSLSLPAQLPKLPHSPGVYLMRNASGQIIYIGKALDLKKRVANYFTHASAFVEGAKTQALISGIRHVDYVPTSSERDALLLEQRLINRCRPVFNIMWKDDKSYPYIALTMHEDFPRIFLTRQKKKDGTLYFGPYPNVSSVRHLLKWAWRKKLFPLRPCRFDIKENAPLPYEKVKSCLYLHTGECSAPCLGKISSHKYKKIADQAKWFFEGRLQKMADQWEKEMNRLSKKMKYEEAAAVRDRIATVRHMQERVTVREMTEEDLTTRIRESRSIQELMRVLDLKKPPELIECFDISHFQGVEKVASMVRFNHGRPDKSQYRKFIIRTVSGIDDFKSMAEVVARRYRRLRDEGKPYPDLVLIDGGKGQLSAALHALAGENIKGIAVAALAKQEEEVFRPGSPEPLRLPEDSPALLLLRYIRDEAHRFAITFHRLRRKKRVFDNKKEEPKHGRHQDPL